MNLNKALRPYLKLFYFTGQSPSINLANYLCKTQKENIIEKLPALLFIILATMLFTSSVILQNFMKDSYGESNSMIANLSILTECSSNYIFYMQCLYNGGSLGEVWNAFKDIYLLFKTNFKYHIDSDVYLKRTFWKIFMIFVSYFMEISFYVPWCFVGRGWYIGIHLKGFQFASVVANIQAVMYVELLHFYLEHLNVVIIETPENNELITNDITFIKTNQSEVAIDNLKMFKNIHFRLWKVTQEINTFFGWGLAAIIIRNFLDASYDIYWAFLIINNAKWTFLELIRN